MNGTGRDGRSDPSKAGQDQRGRSRGDAANAVTGHGEGSDGERRGTPGGEQCSMDLSSIPITTLLKSKIIEHP